MSDHNRNRRSFIDSLKSRFGRRPFDENDEAAPPRQISVDTTLLAGPARGRAPSTSHSSATDASPVAPASPSGTAPRSPLVNLSFNEPPPPYTESIPPSSATAARDPSPTPSHASTASRITLDAVTSREDPYAFLSTFDTIFVIDDSGSMAGRSWREVQAVLANITPICTMHDADGIDIYFLNHRTDQSASPGKASGGYQNVQNADTVRRIFGSIRPGAATPMGTRINSILRPYLRHYEQKLRDNGGDDPDVKPINMIVITDGVPTDDLEGVLLSAARKLDAFDAPPYQVGIQFFQVGNEPGARDHLRDLDDNLSSLTRDGVRDMVDTVTWDAHIPRPVSPSSRAASTSTSAGLTAEGILKVVLGAVVKRLDRQPSGPASQARANARQFLAVP